MMKLNKKRLQLVTKLVSITSRLLKGSHQLYLANWISNLRVTYCLGNKGVGRRP